MGLSTYADLKTALAAHLNRSDLTSYLDDFIDVAEAMHQRDIRIREMIQRDAISIDDRQESVPSGTLEIISLRLLTTPVTVLQYVNLHEMNRLRAEITGKPVYFTIHEEIEFDVEPAETYSGEIIYYKSLTALSSGDTSNALLVKAPDLYLYASLMAAAPFLGADERIQVWGSFYKSGVAAVNDRARAARVVGPLISRVAGATP
jgi:hypothetical protein